MFRGDLMPSAHNAALKKRESRFHGVRVNVAVRVFLGMVDGLVEVLLHLVQRPRVDSRFVGQNNFDVAANVRIDDIPHGLRLRILSPDQTQISIALPDADNDGLVSSWPPLARFAAYVGFVNLDSAAKFLRRYFQHGRPDAVAEVPSRLVADTERALNLTSRHAFLGFTEQVGRKEPFSQGQMRIVKDGAGRCAELVVAGVTIILRAIGNRCGRFFTTWAGNTLAPAQRLDIAAARFIVAELFD